ncbi:calcium-binding protein [Campylobacter sputorum]|uniref:calcium-binding protein n=1 Tax=Campylobacter sputorum TaxID=206 RepID=UPI000B7878A3|nr:calcium-binding protein [Campylobacter sputorum]ASM36288.1 putative membrane protein [Campylobacter sputorum bv. faecalis CCUG 20703]
MSVNTATEVLARNASNVDVSKVIDTSISAINNIFDMVDSVKKELANGVPANNTSISFDKFMDLISKAKGPFGSTLSILDDMKHTLETGGKITDGQILGALSNIVGMAANAAMLANPVIGNVIGIVSSTIAGLATLLKDTTIAQDIVDTSLGIFYKVIENLQSQGVDFSNSLINPAEFPVTLNDLWFEISGKYKDTLIGDDKDNVLDGGRGNDVLRGKGGNDTLIGGTGQDKIYGGEGDDILDGGQGWDYIEGNKGNDILYGGNGLDTLKGGLGDDTYFFKKNDGMDTIKDMPLINVGNQDGGFDTIKFDKSVRKEDITFLNIAGVLSIRYGKGDSGLISVFGQFTDDRRAIEKIELADGEFITKDQIAKVTQDLNAYAREHWIIATHNNVQNNADMMNMVMNSWQNA